MNAFDARGTTDPVFGARVKKQIRHAQYKEAVDRKLFHHDMDSQGQQIFGVLVAALWSYANMEISSAAIHLFVSTGLSQTLFTCSP